MNLFQVEKMDFENNDSPVSAICMRKNTDKYKSKAASCFAAGWGKQLDSDGKEIPNSEKKLNSVKVTIGGGGCSSIQDEGDTTICAGTDTNRVYKFFFIDVT